MSRIANISLRISSRIVNSFYKVSKNTGSSNKFITRSLYSSKRLMCSTAEKTFDKVEEQTCSAEEKKELLSKIEKLTEEVASTKDKYLRTLADGENLRHRLEKQIADSKVYGIQSFSKDVLEVSDVLRKAIENQPKCEVKEIQEHYKGMILIENTLISIFRRHGLEQITPSKGDKFDPSFHEAMFQAENDGIHEAGTIAEIIRMGWQLHNRCIRSSQVGVFK